MLSPQAAMRSTLTYSGSSGYVDDTDSYKLGFTNNILLKPSDALKITASIDYFKDKYSTAYYATPLIQAQRRPRPDRRRQEPERPRARPEHSLQELQFPRRRHAHGEHLAAGRGRVQADQSVTLKNELSYYSADRLWRDADFYTYTAPALITRGITLISHDHEFWSDRMTFNFDGQIGGMRNRFTAGAEYMETTFGSRRHFGSTPGVDIFNPDRGIYPEGSAAITSRNLETAEHVTKAAFAEHAINLTPAWIVAAGIRYETIDLDRTSFNEVTGVTTTFGNELGSTTWRIGTSYEVLPGTTLFAQYAEAVTPVSSALMIASPANTGFKLTTGTSKEAGVKSTMFDGRVTNDGLRLSDRAGRHPHARSRQSQTIVVQGGSQRSRGVEVETAISLTKRWNVSLAGTLIDYRVHELNETERRRASQRATVPSTRCRGPGTR